MRQDSVSYGKFALIYDEFMENAPYDQWVSFTNKVLAQFGKENISSIIDLGCGTGEITYQLAEKGFQLTGVDLSAEMLAIAEQKQQRYNLQNTIRWINMDLRELETATTYDIAISFCDVINYIVDEQEVEQVFNRVFDSLSSGGLFLFDVHSERYLRGLTNQTFGEVRDNASYLWFCHEGTEMGMVEHDLTFFIKNDQQLYDRIDEYHTQRTFSIQKYQDILSRCGFDLKCICNDFQTTLSDDADRIFFVAEKK